MGPVTSESLIDLEDRGDNGGGTIARGQSNSFMVAWMADFVDPEDPDDTRDDSIVAQGFSSLGVRVGPETMPTKGRRAFEFEPKIASAISGSFEIAWTDYYHTEPGAPGQATSIRAQHLSARGHRLGSTLTVAPPSPTGLPIGPDVAMTSQNDIALVWQELGKDGSGDGIFLRLYGTDGSPRSPEISVTTTTVGNQQHPKVLIGPGDRLLVVWDGIGSGDNDGVFAQLFDASLDRVGTEVRLNQAVMERQAWPQVVLLPGDRLFVAWKSLGQDGDGYGVFGRAFAWNGEPLTEEFQVNSYTAGDQGGGIFSGEYAAAADENGNLLVVWTTVGQDGDREGVAGRFFTLDEPVCGDAVRGQAGGCRSITAVDALVILRDAVGDRTCALCTCDADGSGDVTAADAALVLHIAVGLPAQPKCPVCNSANTSGVLKTGTVAQ